jgi:hypothetical protein
MPKSRTLRPSSTLRFRIKLKRLYMPSFGEEAGALVGAMESDWNRKFGTYNMAWNDFINKYGDKIKRGLRGVTRSCLLKMLREKGRYGDTGIQTAIKVCQDIGVPDEYIHYVEEFVRGYTPAGG